MYILIHVYMYTWAVFFGMGTAQGVQSVQASDRSAIRRWRHIDQDANFDLDTTNLTPKQLGSSYKDNHNRDPNFLKFSFRRRY